MNIERHARLKAEQDQKRSEAKARKVARDINRANVHNVSIVIEPDAETFNFLESMGINISEQIEIRFVENQVIKKVSLENLLENSNVYSALVQAVQLEIHKGNL